MECPFCGEDDFDAIGLKAHLARYCLPYEQTPALERRVKPAPDHVGRAKQPDAGQEDPRQQPPHNRPEGAEHNEH